QLLDGDRAEDHEGVDGEVPEHGHLGELRRHGQGVRRLRRACHGARGDHPRDPAGDAEDRGRGPGTARVHYGEGRGLLHLLGRGRGGGGWWTLGWVGVGLAWGGRWGAGDFSGGLASRRASAAGVVVVSQAAGIALLVLLAVATREALPSAGQIGWATLAGANG